MATEPSPNPLAAKVKRATNAQPMMHPVKAHAMVWQHVQKMGPEEQDAHLDRSNYALPILGALASNPNVKPKDVIKAAADAAGAGKIPPSQAVEMISDMPPDPEKLQPWLKQMYAVQFTAAVHLNAAQMARQQATQPAAAPAQAAPAQAAPVAPGVPS